MVTIIDISNELLFTTSRSGGKGGQNVNKVETKVEARWHVSSTKFFTPEQQVIILEKLQNKINDQGFLFVTCSAERTQLGNKEIVIKKINKLVNNALIVVKKRKPTKIPKSVIEKRISDKKFTAAKKELRKGI